MSHGFGLLSEQVIKMLDKDLSSFIKCLKEEKKKISFFLFETRNSEETLTRQSQAP